MGECNLSKDIRLDPIEAALKFVKKYFNNCDGALLAGSVVRGEATKTSDLDIIIFDQKIEQSYRESLIEFGWPIEVFVHNFTSYKQFFQNDYERAKPSLQRMIAEGIVLKEDNRILVIKNEALLILADGPEKWSDAIVKMKRYFITDVLNDFIGCENRFEGIFIANTLAEILCEFVLRTNRKWLGTSKWTYRALAQYDEEFANQFVNAFECYYQHGKKSKIIELTDEILKPFGGRLFEGFSIGKSRENQTCKYEN